MWAVATKGALGSVLHRGLILGGKYRLTDKLGEGGMGAVWAAENISIEAEVAVKVMHPGMHHDTQTVTRFHNEARAAARIGHPSIVRVFDIGEAEDGAPFLVMERLHGESLAERLERDRALPPRDAAEVVVAVLDALEAAHAKDILHRDLKPENIFLSLEGNAIIPKILDFGVSKFLGDDAERVRMTRTGAVIGTPAYMSPEQARGLPDIDLRADLWAMGVILFELITGRMPYEGSNYNALLVQIATTPPPPIRTVVRSLDHGLAAVVDKALAPERSARFDSATAMRDALRAWLAVAPLDLPVVTLPPNPRDSLVNLENSATLPDQKTPVFLRASELAPATPRFAKVLIAGLAAAVVVVGAIALRPVSHATAPTVLAVSSYALHVAGLPEGAHVTLNDTVVGMPTTVAPGRDYRLQVSAPGWRDWVRVVNSPTADVAMTYTGERLPTDTFVPVVRAPDPVPPPPAVVHRTPTPAVTRPGTVHPPTTPPSGHTGRNPNDLLAHDPEY